MQGFATALKQTSRRAFLAATSTCSIGVAAASAVSFAGGMQFYEACVLQSRLQENIYVARDILRECRSEYPELMAEQKKLLDELKSREDSIGNSVSAMLNHVLQPWHLQCQMQAAWRLQRQALSLFLKTCDPECDADIGADVADKIPDDFWQSKLQSAGHLLYTVSPGPSI